MVQYSIARGLAYHAIQCTQFIQVAPCNKEMTFPFKTIKNWINANLLWIFHLDQEQLLAN